MKLTLRKANALQNSIQEQLRSIEVNTVVSLNEFQNVTIEIGRVRDLAVANDKRRGSLLHVYYQIRQLVGERNEASGISAKLAQMAYIDKRLVQLKAIVDSQTVQDEKVIVGKLDKIRNRKSEVRSYLEQDEVTTGVFTEVELEPYKAGMQLLKKDKQRLNDEVLELNVRTEIELNTETVELLKKEGLL